MKVLQSVLRGCVALGLGRHQSIQKCPLNKKNLQTLTLLSLAVSSTSISLFHDANTFQEYTVSAYTSSSVLLALAGYLISIWKSQPICEFIENVEKTVNERK